MDNPTKMTNSPDPKTKTPRRKRLCLRILSSLNTFVLGCLAVKMVRDPSAMTVVVIVIVIATIYKLDRMADSINPFHE